MDHKQLLQDRLFYQSDLFLQESADRAAFEKLTCRLISHLDLSSLDRNRILLSAYEFLKAGNVDDRKITLALSLLDGGIEILKLQEKARDEAIGSLSLEIEQLRAAGEDHDLIDEKETIIHILRTAGIDEVRNIIEKNKGPDSGKRLATPFESAFLRNELREHARGRTGKNWGKFRTRLATMFGLSGQQIAAMKAWESDSLREKGGKTADELIAEIKQKTEKQLSALKAEPASELAFIPTEPAPALPEKIDPSKIYETFTDAAHLAHVKALEPANFTLEKDKISPAQRRWIFALMLCAPEEQKSALRKALAEQVFSCSVPKIGAVTAYLTGGCRQRASDEIKEDIDVTESYLSAYAAKSSPKKSQEHQEFDNEIKNEWRNKLGQFIEKNTVADQRPKMRVLCLPGKKCLEAKMYIDLGFKPENIVGYMKDDDLEAVKEFLENAKALGIVARVADLEEAAAADPLPYDVISLDFFGQLCLKYETIIRRILPAKKVIVCMNVMGKREGAVVQSTFDFFKEHYMQGVGALSNETTGRTVPRFDPENIPEGKEEHALSRDIGMNNTVAQIGRARAEVRPYLRRKQKMFSSFSDDPDAFMIDQLLDDFLLDLGNQTEAVMSSIGSDKASAIAVRQRMLLLVSYAYTGTFLTQNYEKWEYLNSNHTPYYSDFSTAVSTKEAVLACPNTLKFYSLILEEIARNIKIRNQTSLTKHFINTQYSVPRLPLRAENNKGAQISRVTDKRDVIAARNEGRLIAAIRPTAIQHELIQFYKILALPISVAPSVQDIFSLDRKKIEVKKK